MAGNPTEQSVRITSRDDLAAYLASGSKPPENWLIGTEHEKFCFCKDSHERLPYEGANGIGAILAALKDMHGWIPEFEGENIIALRDPSDGATVSLEPGGQLELSGAPLKNLHQTCAEVNNHLEQVLAVGKALGIGFIGLGFDPKTRLEDAPRMPKGRYKIMTAYMPKVGSLGLNMMYRTSTVQVNLDFSDEADMVKKLRVSLALQPLATAIFANSPFTESKPNSFLSYRSEIWRDTDPDRTGMLPFVFEDGMGFERYVDYALDVPMYFVYRDGVYRDVSGLSFRDFLSGKLAGFEGELPTLDDWENHLTTIFPEVRLKRYMEMRGADGGPWKRLCALPAFWVGLLYDDQSLDAAWQLVRGWSADTRQQLRDDVPKLGLRAPLGNGTLRDLAKDIVSLSRQGLERRERLNSFGDSEAIYLDAVEDIVGRGETPAEVLLKRFAEDWGGDISPIFTEEAY